MKLGTKIAIVLILAVLIGGTGYAMKNSGDSSFTDTGTSSVAEVHKGGFWSDLTSWFSGKKIQSEATEGQQTSSESNEDSAANTVPAKQYTNDTYRFSLLLPEALSTEERKDPSGSEVLVFQNGTKSRGFQISIRAFDEAGPITETRIRKDIPTSQMVIDSAESVAIGQGGYPALAFYSQDAALDDTKEIWFVHGGYLYQISGYAKYESWLIDIVSTLNFK